MRKGILPLLLLVGLCLLLFAACTDTGMESPDWPLTLAVENVTPTGLTLRFTQSGGAPSGELSTGTYFLLEQKSGGRWRALPYADALQEDGVGWDDVSWSIPAESSALFDTDWTWLYGPLAPGDYRIGKEVMALRGPGDYDTAMFYAEFTVE